MGKEKEENKESNIPVSNFFSADRPINTKTEDQLGRFDFAKSIADSIAGWKGQESLVIGIFGAWGSGKSSLKNLSLEILREFHKDEISILEFSPWQWSGHDHVAAAFFKEIGIKLGRSISSKSKDFSKKWELYASYFDLGSYVIKVIPKVAILVLLLLSALGISNTLSPWISIPLSILVALLGWFEGLAVRMVKFFKVQSVLEEKTLEERKEELSISLKKMDKPLLVVIDDVDRLTPSEMRLLFQLVKTNANFPNLIYLLLFQRDVVEECLTKEIKMSGKEYLEKIIQIGFDLPQIEQVKLERVLLKGLNDLFNHESLAKGFDEQRWGNIYRGSLRSYFRTLRDVHRYLATLSFHINLYYKNGILEVNPIDLIALEVLRVFEPNIYHKLPGVKHYLTGRHDINYGGFADEKTEVQKSLDTIISIASPERQPVIKEMIKQLFPPVGFVFGGTTYGPGFFQKWNQELRVCVEEFFDRYFSYTIPEGDIPHAEIDFIITNAGNKNTLLLKYRELNKRNLLGTALDRLEVHVKEIPLHDALHFVTSIFDIGDELPESSSGFSFLSNDMHAVRIIYWYLDRETDKTRKLDILKKTMKDSEGVYLPCKYTSIEEDEQEKPSESGNFHVDRLGMEELKRVCVNKIVLAGTSGKLKNQKHLAYILFRWLEWANEKDVKDWVSNLISTNDGLIIFLVAMLQSYTSQTVNEYVTKVHWKMHLESIEKISSLDVLEEKIKKLPGGYVVESNKLALDTFLLALKRRRQGKSDNDWHDIEYEK